MNESSMLREVEIRDIVISSREYRIMIEKAKMDGGMRPGHQNVQNYIQFHEEEEDEVATGIIIARIKKHNTKKFN